MFCQSCGASNADEARFCNMCGSRIAQAGEPGGQLASEAVAPVEAARGRGAYASTVEAPEAHATQGSATQGSAIQGSATQGSATQGSATLQGAPSPYGGDGAGGGPSLMDVSLASIGVRSNKRGFAIVLAVALVLLGVGAGASYWLTSGEVAPAPTGNADATDPFVIGTPTPEGAGTPGVDFVSGSAHPLSGTSRHAPGTTAAQPGSGAASPRAAPRPSHPASAARVGPPPDSTPDSAHTVAATRGGSTMSASTTTMASATQDPAPTRTGTTGTTGSTGTTATTATAGTTAMTEATDSTATPADIPTDAPEERDIELDMYGARVRFVVSRYYAARARGCFDHATLNNPGISGTVMVNMTIAADGQVSRSEVNRNTTGDATLGACLASQVRQWRLPQPPGGELQMQMPFSR